MTCQAMPRTRQPAMPAPGRPGRARRDAASGTVSAASGTVFNIALRAEDLRQAVRTGQNEGHAP
jgi:hypothetical protein